MEKKIEKLTEKELSELVEIQSQKWLVEFEKELQKHEKESCERDCWCEYLESSEYSFRQKLEGFQEGYIFALEQMKKNKPLSLKEGIAKTSLILWGLD